MNGPFSPIPYNPAVSTNIDWEGELAVIIGKRGINITEADAMPYVFGYTVINDTTARDIQMDHGGQWFKGKSLNGHGPMGPWIVVASDIDYNDLNLTTRVNGVVKQQINTSKMYFKVPRLVAELSLGLISGTRRHHRHRHPGRHRCRAHPARIPEARRYPGDGNRPDRHDPQYDPAGYGLR